MADEQSAPAADEGKHVHEFHIQIDREHYVVAQEKMTGAEIRLVPKAPITPDRDLFEVVPGHADRKIENTDVVEMHDGLRFFTAPATINPGFARA